MLLRKFPQLAATGTRYFYSLWDRIWFWDEDPSAIAIRPEAAESLPRQKRDAGGSDALGRLRPYGHHGVLLPLPASK
jgi:hypothetical protein